MRFFFYGLLSDVETLDIVLGRPAPEGPWLPARLADRRLVRLRGDSYPLLVAAPGETVPGFVVEGLGPEDRNRIGFYESVEYAPQTVRVTLGNGTPLEALAFSTGERAVIDPTPWSFEEWRRHHKARDLREAELWMSLYGHLDIETADRLWDRALESGESLESLVTRITGRSGA